MCARNLFDTMGGSAKCLELSAAFYARVDEDPVLGPLFPGKTHKCAIEALSAFLVQFLNGPSENAGRRWYLSLRESHLRFTIGQEERDAWFGLMTRVLRDIEREEPIRQALLRLFEEASAYLVNSGPAVTRTEWRPDPSEIEAHVRERWEEQVALDEAVAAVDQGDLDRVMALVEGPHLRSRFSGNRSVFAHFAGVLIGGRHRVMADFAQRILLANPDLAHESYGGRTLLHAAAAAGALPIVSALLEMGVDPDIRDAGGHTPLYCLANECRGGRPVVKMLVQAGAAVDACDGVKRCTALHMAARRDNADAAEALLDCGAAIEARDSLGETPLRRAVNCGQRNVAALLLARGADPHSVGSRGLTPYSAARTREMRTLLQASATHS